MNSDKQKLLEEDALLLLHNRLESSEVIEVLASNENEKKGKFEHFWSAAEILLNEGNSVPDERRQGNINVRSPICVSLRDLHEKTESLMNTLYPGSSANHVPHQEYFR